MVSNVVVTLYMAHGLVSEARMVFEEIGSPDVVSWNSLITGYAQNGQLQDAVQTVLRMKKVGVVTSTSLSSAVSACLVDKVCGRQLHGLALKLGLESDCFTACALLKMYSRWKEMVDGWKVFEALESKDVASWNALIEGYGGSDFEEIGLHIFCDFMEFGPCVDDITIITVLGICTSLVMLVFGRQVHSLSIKTGLERKVKVQNSMINMYAKCGSLDDSMKIFGNLKDRNVISWTAMIDALARHGKVNEAMELFEKMKSEGTKPNRTTYACVLSACGHAGYIDHGKRVFQSMSIEAEEEHYLCMVRLLAEGGNFDEAEQFIRRSPNKYEESLWQALLVCCKNSNELDKGLMIAEKIRTAELPCKPPMLVLLSQIFAAVGRWDQVEELRGEMKELGLKKEPGCSWVDLDNEFKVFGMEKQMAYI